MKVGQRLYYAWKMRKSADEHYWQSAMGIIISTGRKACDITVALETTYDYDLRASPRKLTAQDFLPTNDQRPIHIGFVDTEKDKVDRVESVSLEELLTHPHPEVRKLAKTLVSK